MPTRINQAQDEDDGHSRSFREEGSAVNPVAIYGRRSFHSSVAVFFTAAVLGSCGSHQDSASHTPSLCEELITTRSDLKRRRALALEQMERDVDLGLHGIPGQTLDAVETRDADAYVRRVRERWREDDARLASALTEADATLQAKGCRQR